MRRLNYTGERYVPGQAAKNVRQDHERRYQHIKSRVKGKRVLDIACGTGYGMRIISSRDTNLVGIDNSLAALQYAKVHHSSPKSWLVQADAGRLPLKSSFFDAVVSFETIEHIDDPRMFLSEVKRVLTPGGWLIVSTPVKKGDDLDEFHLQEYTGKEFVALMADFFRVEKVEGQRFMLTPLFKLFSSRRVRKLRRISLFKNVYRKLYGRDEIRPLSSRRFFKPNFLLVTGVNEK